MRSLRLPSVVGTMIVLSACGGSSPQSTTKTSSAAPAFDAAQRACATTFKQIIQGVEALPPDAAGAVPGWVQVFMSRNQARGLPTTIGNGGYLVATGPNTGDACTLTFDLPAATPPGATVTFGVGDASFSGSNPPLLGPSQGPHLPNAVIGADGQLSPVNQSAGAETGSTGATNPPPTTTSVASPSTASSTTQTGSTTSGTATLATGPSASTAGTECGTVTGGNDDYQGQTLTVYAGTGVSCATAMRVMSDLSAGKAENHQGANDALSYFTVDGWTCPYGNMDIQVCSKGSQRIRAYVPGASP
jgi:hypothetical protein